MKDNPMRLYKMSDADLIDTANGKHTFMLRDAVSFLDFGIDSIMIAEFNTLIDAYEVLTPDNVYEARVKTATQEKNNLREEAMTMIRTIRARGRVVWGERSPKNEELAAKGISRMNDREFLTVSRSVVTQATIYLTELTPAGLSQIQIDALEAKNQEFEDKMEDKKSKVADRDIAADDRKRKGNEIYELMVKYCDIGKAIYFEVDEAKYNDYIIYNTVHSGLSKPQNLTAVVDAVDPAKVNIDFDPVAGAITYKLYFNETVIGNPSGSFEDIGESATNHFDSTLITGKRNYWKVRAFSDDSNSDYSDQAYIDG